MPRFLSEKIFFYIYILQFCTGTQHALRHELFFLIKKKTLLIVTIVEVHVLIFDVSASNFFYSVFRVGPNVL